MNENKKKLIKRTRLRFQFFSLLLTPIIAIVSMNFDSDFVVKFAHN